MDSNHDIVPTLRMFNGVMTGIAADEIEALRAEVNRLKAQLTAAPAQGEPVAAWINYPCKIENGEFAGHGEPELSFSRAAYGYDYEKAEPLFRRTAPAVVQKEPVEFSRNYPADPAQGEPVPQNIPGQSEIAQAAFMRSVYWTMSNRDDLLPVWLDAWSIAKQSVVPAQGEPVVWRERCAALVDIYDDALNNAPEDRCYVDGSFKAEMDEVRALLSTPQPTPAVAKEGMTEELRTTMSRLANGLELMTKLAAERACMSDVLVTTEWIRHARALLGAKGE